MNTPTIPRQNLFGLAALLLTFAIAIGWQTTTPYHSDDYFYRHCALDTYDDFWNMRGDLITSFDQVPAAVVNHWITNNGRLSNIAYIAVQPLPKAVTGLIIGLALGSVALLLFRFGGPYRRSLSNPWLAVAIPLLLWTGFQWNDQFQSADFQFNYTLPSVMMLGLLLLFDDPARRPGPWAWVLLAVFAPWHECFTISLGVFMGVQWLYDRRRTTLILIGVLILGVLVTMSSGSTVRALRSESASLLYYPFTLVVSRMWPAFVALAWWLWRRRRLDPATRRALDRYAAGLVATMAVAVAILFVLTAPQRSHWPVELLAVALIVKTIATYSVPARPWPAWIPATLLALYAAWGTSLVYWQVRIARFSAYSLDTLSDGRQVVIDRDRVLDNPAPFWLMDMVRPQYSPFHFFEHRALAMGAHRDPNSNYIALPPELDGKPFDQWPKVEGNTDLRFAAGQLPVRRHDGNDLTGRRLSITFGPATISTAPLDYLIGALRGVARGATVDMRIINTGPVVYRGDTLDVLFFEHTPRTVQGRPILAINYPAN